MSKSYPVDADSIISAFSSLSKSWSYIDMHFAADMKSFRGYFPLDEDEVENCFVEMFLQEDCCRLLCAGTSTAIPSAGFCSAVELCLSRDYFARFTGKDLETMLRRLGFSVPWFHLFTVLPFLREGQVTGDVIERSNPFDLDDNQRADIGIIMLKKFTSAEALSLYRMVSFERAVDGLINVLNSLACDQFNRKAMDRFLKLQEPARNASDYFLSDDWNTDRNRFDEEWFPVSYSLLSDSKESVFNLLSLNEEFNRIIRSNTEGWIEQLDVRCFYLRTQDYAYIESAVLRPVIRLLENSWEISFQIVPQPLGVYPELLILERDYFISHTVSDLQFILRAMGYDSEQQSLLYDIPILKPGDYTVPEDDPFLSRNLNRFGIIRRVTGRIDRTM